MRKIRRIRRTELVENEDHENRALYNYHEDTEDSEAARSHSSDEAFRTVKGVHKSGHTLPFRAAADYDRGNYKGGWSSSDAMYRSDSSDGGGSAFSLGGGDSDRLSNRCDDHDESSLGGSLSDDDDPNPKLGRHETMNARAQRIIRSQLLN